jgi:Domain of unknown function (DUF4382)
MRPWIPTGCVVLLLCLVSFGCAGGAPSNAASTLTSPTAPVTSPVTDPITTPVTNGAAVSIVISDPAACRASGGPFTHVYVTITDVQASTNADAPSNDASFVDLTPGLSVAPQQVDLLGQANSKCFLASLGIGQEVTAGDYRQVRIFLAPDSRASSVSNNACGASYSNCLVRTDNSLHDLELPAAASQGIELATNHIINGSIAFNAGDQPYIDLNFDVCSSILATADGQYEFNPIAHAGLIPSTGSTISGTVVSSKTGQPLLGGNVVVALEQKDATTGIDRILMRTAAASDGTFILCPVPQGTYDLVAVGMDGASVSYSAGVETGIQSGQLAGKIPLVPGSQQGTLEGLITTQGTGANPLGVSLAVQADALQQIATNGTTITVPLLPRQSPYNQAMLTMSGSNCAPGTDCAPFAMQLPTSTPNVIACSEQTAQFKQKGSTPGYTAESVAATPGTGSAAACSAERLQAPNGPVNVGSGETAMTSAISFTRCQ